MAARRGEFKQGATSRRQRKHVEPENAFLVAKAYHQAADLLEKAYTEKTLGPVDVSIGIPQMMLVAFSCELYMKAAHAVENNGALIGDEHRLNKLFSKLSQGFREAVRAEWDKTNGFYFDPASSFKERDLYANLKVSQDAFEQLRYFYESKAREFHLGPLPDILQKVLHDRHPELERSGPLLVRGS